MPSAADQTTRDRRPFIDLEPQADALYDDPCSVLAALRARGPVHFVRMPGGSRLWLVVGYDEAWAALNDPTLSKDWIRSTGRIGPNAIGANMLSTDPPDHTRLRRLVSRQFTARRVASLAPRIEEIADDLLDKLKPADQPHDLVAEFAFPLTVTVISELLGVPFLDRTEFSGLCARIFVPADDPEQARSDLANTVEYFDGLIEEKRRHPGDDLLSALIRTTDEDADRLTRTELRATTFLLLVAGHATTTNLIANGALTLLQHPEQLAALCADWTLLPGAVEEILRYEAPQVFSTRRFTTTPWRVGESDVVIPGGGETVMVALSAADRDPTRFPSPDTFDIHRPSPAHLAFGHGIHYCLGAPLARLQATTALRSLFTRFPAVALAPGGERVWRRSLMTRGLTRLPVHVDG